MAFLSEYWNKRRTRLKFLIRTPKRKFSQKRFHVLRVELKKLQSLLLMVDFLEKDFDRKKFYEPFKSLFSQAGKVRELQIEKEILKEYRNDSLLELRKSLDQKIRKERSEFFKKRNLRLNCLMEKRLKSLKPILKKLKKVDLHVYLKTLLEEIKVILAIGKLEDRTGHLLRKKLKTLRYNLDSYQKPSRSHRKDEHEELIDLLGNWHDQVRVNELLLEDLDSSKFSPEELIKIQHVREKIVGKIEKISGEINQKIPLFDDLIFLPSKK